MEVNYKKIYDALYSIGYHSMAKNHGQKYVKDLCNRFSFKKVLEVGCSNGLATMAFRAEGKLAYGMDVSPIAIRDGVKQYKTVNCIEGSVLDIPFKDNFFQAVFTCDVLEHLQPQDVDKGIKEINRVATEWLFIKVSETVEGNRDHLNRAMATFPALFDGIQNLHLTVMSYGDWIERFVKLGKFELKENIEGMLVFKRYENNKN